MANEDLHKPLKAINQTVAKVRGEIQKLKGELEKIRTLIERSTREIRDAIEENIQAQAELKLMEHVMDVRSVKPQIDAEYEQITTERGELKERLESIGERYQRKHTELDETAQERIRDVGEHIFEIDEEQFEAGIEEPFTSQVTTTWQALQAHNAEISEERADAIKSASGDVVQSIYDYIDRQERLVERIDAHRLDADELSVPTDREVRLQVPYHVVEYEIDGVTEREVVVPSRLEHQDGGWCSVSLAPIEGAESLLSNVGGPMDATERDGIDASELRTHLESHGESSFGLSYTEELVDAVPDEGIGVAVEGGKE